MNSEQLYFSSNPFGQFRIDEEGRIIDNINNQTIGISNQKKREILDDYDSLANENIALKDKLEEIEKLLELHKDCLPEELRRLIEKPPTVEALQAEISDLKNMMAMLIQTVQTQGGAKNNDNIRNVQKSETKPASSQGSRSDSELYGPGSEQS